MQRDPRSRAGSRGVDRLETAARAERFGGRTLTGEFGGDAEIATLGGHRQVGPVERRQSRQRARHGNVGLEQSGDEGQPDAPARDGFARRRQCALDAKGRIECGARAGEGQRPGHRDGTAAHQIGVGGLRRADIADRDADIGLAGRVEVVDRRAGNPRAVDGGNLERLVARKRPGVAPRRIDLGADRTAVEIEEAHAAFARDQPPDADLGIDAPRGEQLPVVRPRWVIDLQILGVKLDVGVQIELEIAADSHAAVGIAAR